MTENICKKCGKNFPRKYDLDRHLNRVTDCVTGSKTKKKIIQYECPMCKKKFPRKDSMIRHKTKCKLKKTVKINKIKGDDNVNINIDGNKNKTTNIIKSPIYLNVVLFSKDGIKCLNSKDYKKILESNRHLIEELITQVNFNPDKPEHHNVYYPDLKSSYGVVYEDNKWITKKIDEILNTLLDVKIEDLNGILDDMGDFLNKKSRNKIKKAVEEANHNTIPPGSRKRLMKYIKTILYNNKDMIIKTRKLTKEQEKEIMESDEIVPEKRKK